MSPLLLSALLLAGSASPEEERLPVVDVTEADLEEPPGEVRPGFKDPRVQVLMGGAATLGNQAPTSVTPLAIVSVDWNLAGRVRALEAHVSGTFAGLPDAQVTLRDAREFDAIEVALGASYHPIRKLSASGYCEAGFASRLEGDVPAQTSAPLWSSCGLRFEDRGQTKARLLVGVGPDERLGWGWTMAAHVRASIRVVEIGPVGSALMVRAILGLETPVGQKQRVNVITAGVAMSWDNR